MNAVIKVGGKQYYVTEGSEIYVEKLDCEAGNVVNFDQVLMLDSKVGNPYLTNVTVQGEVIKNGKNKKIKVFILPSLIHCLMLFLSVCRPKFLTYVIFPLSEELSAFF